MEIKILATIKFTEPLTTSNAGLSSLLIFFDGRSEILNCFSMIVYGFCKEVFKELPMEFAVEAQKLMEVSLEGAVG